MLISFLLTAAAAIRKASTTTSLNNHSPHVNRTMITPKRAENRPNKTSDLQDEDEIVNNEKNRNRSELMYEDEDDKPNEKLDKIIQKEKERLEREKNEKKNSEKNSEKNRNNNKRHDSTSSSTSKASKNDSVRVSASNDSHRSAASTSKTKRQSSPISAPPVKKMKETKERTYKPFHKLLEGVVLVISGIQVRHQIIAHLSASRFYLSIYAYV